MVMAASGNAARTDIVAGSAITASPSGLGARMASCLICGSIDIHSHTAFMITTCLPSAKPTKPRSREAGSTPPARTRELECATRHLLPLFPRACGKHPCWKGAPARRHLRCIHSHNSGYRRTYISSTSVQRCATRASRPARRPRRVDCVLEHIRKRPSRGANTGTTGSASSVERRVLHVAAGRFEEADGRRLGALEEGIDQDGDRLVVAKRGSSTRRIAPRR